MGRDPDRVDPAGVLEFSLIAGRFALAACFAPPNGNLAAEGRCVLGLAQIPTLQSFHLASVTKVPTIQLLQCALYFSNAKGPQVA